MSILVVGSVAYDTVETPFGRAERVLGGSASFFSVAASFFTPVNLVGVVGHDFGEAQLAAFRGRPIDLEGLERMEGKTFHWQGKYSLDLNSRDTICTDLNVFEFFKPKIPARYRGSEVVFLGNIDPVLQREVLEQVERPRLVACDTMNFWIHGKPEELRKTLAKVQILLINDQEARELAGEWNLVKAARAIRAMGPRTLVVKKGEHGVLMFSRGRLLRGARAARSRRSSIRPARATRSPAASSATSRAPGRRATPPCAGPSSWAARWPRSASRPSASTACCALTRPRSTRATGSSSG